MIICQHCGHAVTASPKALTGRQAEVLGYIKCYIDAKGIAPTGREIAQEFGIPLSSAYYHLNVLVEKQALVRTPCGNRGIAVVESNAGGAQ